MTLLWATAGMTVFVGLGVLALDVGRSFLAKSQLQNAVDDAALYGVTGLDLSADDARDRVREALLDNAVGGQHMAVDDADIEFGVWDPLARTFLEIPDNESATATALRLTVHVDSSTNPGMKGFFTGLFGDDTIGMTARVTVTRGEPFDLEIDSRATPYLAGMPDGSGVPYTKSWQPGSNHVLRKGITPSKNRTFKHGEDPGDIEDVHEAYGPNDPVDPALADYVWTESGDLCQPLQVEIKVTPGQVLYFRDVNGGTGDYASQGKQYSLDGNLSRTNIAQQSVNGFDSTTGPLNALMGVFLTDAAPTTTSYQEGLDFSTTNSRNYDALLPDTKQIFFIGDGMANEGSYKYEPRLQRIVVPEGATRLYLGLQDEYGWWWDNFGSVRTTMFRGKPTIVE